jgi:lipoprotein-anchoring transpeptidase ErfK/SrfK
MRTAIRSVLVVLGIAVAVVAGPGVRLAATSLSRGDFTIASVLPTRGAVVGVAHPVVVTFSRPIARLADRHAAERAIDVTSTPSMTGRFDWLDNYVVQWIPDRFWPAHSGVALSVGGRPTEFQTGAVVLGVADIANHTFTVSIDGVQATPPPPLPAPHHRPHWGEEGVIPASMGRPDFATPVGSYAVMSKDRSVVMDSSTVGIPVNDPDGYRLTVDYAVRFSNHGLYVHSAPWAVKSMGLENVSHGCISLSPVDAEWYFDAVHVGDPIVVQEGVPPGEKSAVPADPAHLVSESATG